jgi:hypothetical protein
MGEGAGRERDKAVRPTRAASLLALAVLLAACAAIAPPPEPVDQRALAAIAEGAAVKRQINIAAGKAHGERVISQAQFDAVTTAAVELEARLNETSAQLRAYLTSEAPDAGSLEASLVRLETARAHLMAVADGLGLKWRTP